MIQAARSRGVAWCTKRSGRRVKDGNLLSIHSSGAEGEGKGAIKSWVLFIEEEVMDEIVEVCLANVFTQCLE